jgi:hypothetical protein
MTRRGKRRCNISSFTCSSFLRASSFAIRHFINRMAHRTELGRRPPALQHPLRVVDQRRDLSLSYLAEPHCARQTEATRPPLQCNQIR